MTFTWLLVRENYEEKAVADAIKELVTYCIEEGQDKSKELGYIPLPTDVREKVKAALKNVKSEEA